MNTPAADYDSSSSNRAQNRVEHRARVAVLYGGQSTEHSVSCISAGAIMDHLDSTRYEVIPVGITPQGAWVPGATDTTELRANGREMPTVRDRGEHVQLVLGAQRGELRYISGERAGETYATIDVIFPVLHGQNGEDGTIQGLFELAGVPYVGNGVLASAAGMDKEYTKRLASQAGVPCGEELILTENRELTADEQQRLGLPVFVKPARGGSSIGISKVDEWEDFAQAVEIAFDYDGKVIVESMIHGREVECGVLQYPEGSVIASAPAMLEGTEDGNEGFYGFDAKYVDNNVTPSIPAPIGEEATAEVRRLAVRTFEALNCEGLARVDFFVTDSGQVILNEINTLPGFTPISMYPQMFIAGGMEYSQLLDILIARALVND
ncbi:D-alanine--D-alanine ligase family protein [Corynebacterium auriscanis]|uniref:D-alanine--D-alanine ligase family protein n=1 Tax=Corynebacterium auriscanis TaxID=99807 RepID=UPI0024AE2BED|nr:D-alanine--D-alanine ligase family protein [Corynebacterium auriscanis]